jgi:hypothetical protein
VREKWEEKTWTLEGEVIAIKSAEETSRRKLENEKQKYHILASEVKQIKEQVSTTRVLFCKKVVSWGGGGGHPVVVTTVAVTAVMVMIVV